METSALVSYVPGLFIAVRALLGPLLLAGAWLSLPPAAFLAGVLLGFLSDVFDGILARRLQLATERLRVADSWADACFYIGVALAVWRYVPAIIHAYRFPLLLVLAMQLLSYAFDLVKYHRIASFHAYIAKLWGITLMVAVFGLLCRRQGVWLWPAIVVGVIGNIEAFAMKMVLPAWRYDVHSLRHALRLRREEEQAEVRGNFREQA